MGGNVYPMAATGLLRDSKRQLTLHTHSAMGAASMQEVLRARDLSYPVLIHYTW